MPNSSPDGVDCEGDRMDGGAEIMKTFTTYSAVLVATIGLGLGSLSLAGEKAEKKEQAAKKPDVTLNIGVIPAVMQFDKKELKVKAGQQVKLIFKNEKCPLQHNFLLLKPGTTEKVGALADKMITEPDAMKKAYIPKSDDILVKSKKLIGPTQSEEFNFKAPEKPGDYPYICTFPGHWRLMKGILKVGAK